VFCVIVVPGVLFAAIQLGRAGCAIGIEMNKEFCDIQNAAVSAFASSLSTSAHASSAAAATSHTSAPITIVHADVASALDSVNAADVVVGSLLPVALACALIFSEQILHNAFQFFHSPAEARRLWQLVIPAVKAHALIVSSPDLQEQVCCIRFA
jgi:predicted tellurium resistance membrane protein TerC